jgi:hypothetical protein
MLIEFAGFAKEADFEPEPTYDLSNEYREETHGWP